MSQESEVEISIPPEMVKNGPKLHPLPRLLIAVGKMEAVPLKLQIDRSLFERQVVATPLISGAGAMGFVISAQ